ncbi:exosome complex component rrp45 [Homalodisca vitripennis]|uniref:exosome complex component rrp45 n=1 Tax=Homalodisca vitripennis TaxID=197043 RepID=UPI001EEA226A|nr:exosome complex component rrp45 [Homalodisca vitripennis]
MMGEVSKFEKRLDGRAFDEFRPVDIHFGKEWGSCQVSFGETKVLAKATCDVQLPKATRPNEGLLHLNVELSPMAAAHFETGPQSELGVHLNRLLEKFFKESRCVDLESLCIVAEEKVWNVRVDINVLNSDGNLVGCCSAAALAALMHFRRPDFTLSGEQVIIHSPSEKDPLPISLHHHPVAIAFAVFNNGERVMVDPTNAEERVSQAQLVLAVNTYRELCGLHLGGSALAAPDIILQCAHRSGGFSVMLIDKIKEALEADLKARSEGPVAGLTNCINLMRILSSSQDRNTFFIKGSGRPRPTKMDVEETIEDSHEDSDDDVRIISVGKQSAELLPSRGKFSKDELKPWEPSGKLGNSWVVIDQDDDSAKEDEKVNDNGNENVNDSDDDIEVVKEVTLQDRIVANINLDGDSEEEDTTTLKSSDLDKA